LPMPEIRSLQMASTLFNEDKFLEASEVFSSCASKLEKEDSHFWAAISRENEGKSLLSWSKQQRKQDHATEQAVRGKEALLKAASNYGSEAEIYENANSVFLAERASSNKKWCESVVNNQTSQSDLLSLKHR